MLSTKSRGIFAALILSLAVPCQGQIWPTPPPTPSPSGYGQQPSSRQPSAQPAGSSSSQSNSFWTVTRNSGVSSSQCLIVPGRPNCIQSDSSSGSYHNNVNCTFELERSGELDVVSWNVEATHDGFRLNSNSASLLDREDEVDGLSVSQGDRMFWRTDGSVVRSGWEVCLINYGTAEPTPGPTPSNTPSPVTSGPTQFETVCGPSTQITDLEAFVYGSEESVPSGAVCTCSTSDNPQINCDLPSLDYNGKAYRARHTLSFSTTDGDFGTAVTQLTCTDSTSVCNTVDNHLILLSVGENGFSNTCVLTSLENFGQGCACQTCSNNQGVQYNCNAGLTSQGCATGIAYQRNPFTENDNDNVEKSEYSRVCGPNAEVTDITNFVYKGSPPPGASCQCHPSNEQIDCTTDSVDIDGIRYQRLQGLVFGNDAVVTSSGTRLTLPQGSSREGKFGASFTALTCIDSDANCDTVLDRVILVDLNEQKPDEYNRCAVLDIETGDNGQAAGCDCDFCSNDQAVSFNCFEGLVSESCQSEAYLLNPFIGLDDDTSPAEDTEFGRLCGPDSTVDLTEYVYEGNAPSGASCSCSELYDQIECDAGKVKIDGVNFDRRHILTFGGEAAVSTADGVVIKINEEDSENAELGSFSSILTSLICSDFENLCDAVEDRIIFVSGLDDDGDEFESCAVIDIEGQPGNCECSFCDNGRGVTYDCYEGLKSESCETEPLASNPFLSDGGSDGDSSDNIGIVIGAVIGGVVVVLLVVGAVLWFRRNNNTGKANGENTPSPSESISASSPVPPDEASAVVGVVPVDVEEGATPIENREESPEAIVLPPPVAPQDGDSVPQVVLVTAPTGVPLGLTMGERGVHGGFLVSAVKPTSPLAGQVHVGDELTNLNDENFTTIDKTDMLDALRSSTSQKVNRQLTFMRAAEVNDV